MRYPQIIRFAAPLLCAALVGTPMLRAQVCEPLPDASACAPVACSLIPEDQCIAAVFRLNVASGAITTEACACQDFNFCHVEAGDASFFAVGGCPSGERCALIATDTDNDGIDDRFSAVCEREGVCCLDIDDGPLAFDTCVPSGPNACLTGGGLFHEGGPTCADVQACCFSFAGSSYCADAHPLCCVDSGGVPLGPGSTCTNVGGNQACPPSCGGIAGIPCENPDEFCMLPIGGCCCDFMGVCMPVPDVCPLYWDPVCGCDGITYGNPCEAFAARVSIDHMGPCLTGACCLPNAAGVSSCVVTTEETCKAEGGTFLGLGTVCPPDPSIPCGLATGACCVADPAGNLFCFVGSRDDCLVAGGKYQGDGTECPLDPTFPCGLPTGACCVVSPDAVSPTCTETTEPECLAGGGVYLGDGTVCPPDGTTPCPPPTGACCLDDPVTGTTNCLVVTAGECATQGGTYLGDGTTCPPDPTLPCRPPVGACCFSPPGSVSPVCMEVTLDECVGLGGDYLGDGTLCPDDPTLGCPSPCPQLCSPAQDCFSGCGTLVQGTECVLFQADSGGLFLLSDLGGFAVGDRVRVTGCLDPTCVTVCLAGDGCILGNTIAPCGAVCGGIAGIPCTSADEFCKFPVGTCGAGDVFGVCTPVPGTGCPEIYDPVCGCDGVTYPNECEADAARVSIAHFGECDVGACAAVRNLADPQPSYCPQEPKTVRIALNVPGGTTVIALEDAPPAGWNVISISDDGTFDAANGKVKWGPFFAPFPPGVSYVVVPAPGDGGPKCFDGTISIDGMNRRICGDPCIDRFCRPFLQADLPQPPCPSCPVSDCNSCDGSPCRDGRIALCEVIGYACAWKTGCNDDLAGMTRAAFIWKNGECYCWDELAGNWFPSACPPPASGLCINASARSVPTGERPVATATLQFRAQRSRRGGGVLHVRAEVSVHAPPGVSAAALDFHVPRGWQITAIRDHGTWDALNRKVKWGPFFDELSRTVVLTASRPLAQPGIGNHKPAVVDFSAGFSGSVSLDGVNDEILVKESTTKRWRDGK